jgi:ribosomal-protein-alanine N-acetyltransferase
MPNVRLATAADISRMLEIERSATSAAHWSRAQYEEVFREEIDGVPYRMALVIEDEQLIAGFLIARFVAAEVEIENIVIAQSARRLGFGSRLVKEFLHIAWDGIADSIFLEVRESNLAARALYEKFSFSETGRRKNYYRDPAEDAIQYRLSKP